MDYVLNTNFFDYYIKDDEQFSSCGYFSDTQSKINEVCENIFLDLNSKQDYIIDEKERFVLYKDFGELSTGSQTTNKNVSLLTPQLTEHVTENTEHTINLSPMSTNSENYQLNNLYDKEPNPSSFSEISIFYSCKYNETPRKFLPDCLRKKFKVALHKFIKVLLHTNGFKVKNLSQEFISTINIEFNKPLLEKTIGEIYEQEQEIIEEYHNREFKSAAKKKFSTKASNNFVHNKNVVHHEYDNLLNLKYKYVIKRFLETAFKDQLSKIKENEGDYYCKRYQEIAENYWIYYDNGKPNNKIKKERKPVEDKTGLGRKRKSTSSYYS
jgi:hypothetical protein